MSHKASESREFHVQAEKLFCHLLGGIDEGLPVEVQQMVWIPVALLDLWPGDEPGPLSQPFLQFCESQGGLVLGSDTYIDIDQDGMAIFSGSAPDLLRVRRDHFIQEFVAADRDLQVLSVWSADEYALIYGVPTVLVAVFGANRLRERFSNLERLSAALSVQLEHPSAGVLRKFSEVAESTWEQLEG